MCDSFLIPNYRQNIYKTNKNKTNELINIQYDLLFNLETESWNI